MLVCVLGDECVGQVIFFVLEFSTQSLDGSVLESLGIWGRKSTLGVGCYCLVVKLGSGLRLEGSKATGQFVFVPLKMAPGEVPNQSP